MSALFPRQNIRRIIARPQASDGVSPSEKPMWIKLIFRNPPNPVAKLAENDLDAVVVVYGKTGDVDTERLLNDVQKLFYSYGSMVNFKFVDVIENPTVAAINGVSKIPALILYSAGVKQKKLIRPPPEEIVKLLNIARRWNSSITSWLGAPIEVSEQGVGVDIFEFLAIPATAISTLNTKLIDFLEDFVWNDQVIIGSSAGYFTTVSDSIISTTPISTSTFGSNSTSELSPLFSGDFNAISGEHQVSETSSISTGGSATARGEHTIEEDVDEVVAIDADVMAGTVAGSETGELEGSGAASSLGVLESYEENDVISVTTPSILGAQSTQENVGLVIEGSRSGEQGGFSTDESGELMASPAGVAIGGFSTAESTTIGDNSTTGISGVYSVAEITRVATQTIAIVNGSGTTTESSAISTILLASSPSVVSTLESSQVTTAEEVDATVDGIFLTAENFGLNIPEILATEATYLVQQEQSYLNNPSVSAGNGSYQIVEDARAFHASIGAIWGIFSAEETLNASGGNVNTTTSGEMIFYMPEVRFLETVAVQSTHPFTGITFTTYVDVYEQYLSYEGIQIWAPQNSSRMDVASYATYNGSSTSPLGGSFFVSFDDALYVDPGIGGGGGSGGLENGTVFP